MSLVLCLADELDCSTTFLKKSYSIEHLRSKPEQVDLKVEKLKS